MEKQDNETESHLENVDDVQEGETIPNEQASEMHFKLKSPTVLLKEAFLVYRKNILYYIGIILLGLVAGGVLAGIFLAVFTAFGGNVAPGVLNLVLPALSVVAFLATLLWSQSTLFFAITKENEEKNVLRTYKKALPFLLGYLWISFLVGVIVLGGFYFFIIPGIILSVYFAFAPFVLFSENIRGFDALSKSREYVRDYWWAIFGRVVVLTLLAVGVQLFLSLFFSFIASVSGGSFQNFTDLLTSVVSLLLMPYFMIYTYQLLKNVREIKGDVPSETTAKQKILYIGLAAVTFLVMAGVVFMASTLSSMSASIS